MFGLAHCQVQKSDQEGGQDEGGSVW